MLYITTRTKTDTYTAHRALHNDFASDGGQFIPFRFPVYTDTDIAQLASKSFNQTICDILNLFFSVRLECWSLEFNIGRNIVHLVPVNHKIAVAELWHHLDGNFTHLENNIYKLLAASDSSVKAIGWAKVAIRIGVLFGVYGEMLRNELIASGQPFDICVANDDFLTPMAAAYCRRMGLPIETIICSCEDDSSLWDFFHRGVISTTLIQPKLQSGMERLLQEALGCEYADAFSKACSVRGVYSLDNEALLKLNSGLFCSVVGSDRAKKTINSVFRSGSYIVDPKTALCYSGLQDYRAKTGKSNLTVIFAEDSPKIAAEMICDSLGITPDKLDNYINRS